MTDLIESIINKNFTEANSQLNERLEQIAERKITEVKKMVAAKLEEQTTVQDDGNVHTASGRKVLPSVRKAELGLTEAKKVDPKAVSPREFYQAKRSAAGASRKAVANLELKKKLAAAQADDAKKKEARQLKNRGDMSLRREKLVQKIKKIRYVSTKRKEKSKDIAYMHDLMRNDPEAFGAELEKRIGMPLDKASQIISNSRPKPNLTQRFLGMLKKK